MAGGNGSRLRQRRAGTARGAVMAEEALLCPSCGDSQPPTERFCARCGMPLVYPAGSEGATIDEPIRWASCRSGLGKSSPSTPKAT